MRDKVVILTLMALHALEEASAFDALVMMKTPLVNLVFPARPAAKQAVIDSAAVMGTTTQTLDHHPVPQVIRHLVGPVVPWVNH